MNTIVNPIVMTCDNEVDSFKFRFSCCEFGFTMSKFGLTVLKRGRASYTMP